MSDLPPGIASVFAGIAGGPSAGGRAATPALHGGPTSAADVLASGEPCWVVVASAQPMGLRQAGGEVHGFVLQVLDGAAEPTQVQVSLAVPEAALALLAPGTQLPACRLPDVPGAVVIDWPAALA